MAVLQETGATRALVLKPAGTRILYRIALISLSRPHPEMRHASYQHDTLDFRKDERMASLLAGTRTLYTRFTTTLAPLDGLPPLLLRLYLAPVMMQAGWMKLANFESTAQWFGNPDWGLGMPFPYLMTALAAGAEFFGGIALIGGLATRLVAIPLAITMLVAMLTVHWDNGWHAISDSSSWLANERVLEAAPRKAKVIDLLKQHGDYGWLTERGSVTILNNGIEFAATYFIMLLSLLFTGGGRYFSIDYWIDRWCQRRIPA